MTAPAITLSSPADLLAVIPRLLGFEPHASIVVLSLRQRRIGLTQRMDLPGLEDVDPAARTMLRPLLRDEADGALVVGYDDQPQQSRPVMDALTALLAAHRVPVLDRLVVHAGRWRSLDCTHPGCCPPDGAPLPTPSEAAGVLAEFVGHGAAPLPDRDQLAHQLEAGELAAEVHHLLTNAPEQTAKPWTTTQDRDRLAGAWARILDPDPLAAPVRASDAALALASLARIPVRDGLVAMLMPSTLAPDRLPDDVQLLVTAIRGRLRCSLEGRTVHRAIQQRLAALCAAATDPHAAPALTVLASYGWWRGDGVTARLALARALRCNPGYRLARLLEALVDVGIRAPLD